MQHGAPSVAPRLDFRTTLGHGRAGKEGGELGIPTIGPTLLVTDLCMGAEHGRRNSRSERRRALGGIPLVPSHGPRRRPRTGDRRPGGGAPACGRVRRRAGGQYGISDRPGGNATLKASPAAFVSVLQVIMKIGGGNRNGGPDRPAQGAGFLAAGTMAHCISKGRGGPGGKRQTTRVPLDLSPLQDPPRGRLRI